MSFVPNSRNTDPITSHIAGNAIEHSGVAENQRLQALKAVKEYPARTSAELSVLTGLDRYMLGRRLSELIQLKQGEDRFKRQCRASGKLCVAWELKSQEVEVN